MFLCWLPWLWKIRIGALGPLKLNRWYCGNISACCNFFLSALICDFLVKKMCRTLKKIQLCNFVSDRCEKGMLHELFAHYQRTLFSPSTQLVATFEFHWKLEMLVFFISCAPHLFLAICEIPLLRHVSISCIFSHAMHNQHRIIITFHSLYSCWRNLNFLKIILNMFTTPASGVILIIYNKAKLVIYQLTIMISPNVFHNKQKCCNINCIILVMTSYHRKLKMLVHAN